MSAGQEFWIVATGCDSAQKDGYLGQMTDPVLTKPAKFNIPEGLPFGSFDSLVRLTDDLAKADQQLDSMVHRMERQVGELNPKAALKIKTQRQEKLLSEYLASWEWDEAKYPKSRMVSDNLASLNSIIGKLDEEVRKKTGEYSEAKTQKGNIQMKDTHTLATADLVDILLPGKVTMSKNGAGTDDFITTEHMSTVCVIVSRGNDKEFLAKYEDFSEHVVPGSAKKFGGMEDKDGSMLFRVVVIKGGVDAFKKGCREAGGGRGFVPRDFEYSEAGYKELLNKRAELEETTKTLLSKLVELTQMAWSDVMVAWLHVKAMRVFVECTMRYGISTPICSLILSPKAGASVTARRVLAGVLKSSVKAPASADKMTEAAAEDGEEYYPYVSVAFTPIAPPH